MEAGACTHLLGRWRGRGWKKSLIALPILRPILGRGATGWGIVSPLQRSGWVESRVWGGGRRGCGWSFIIISLCSEVDTEAELPSDDGIVCRTWGTPSPPEEFLALIVNDWDLRLVDWEIRRVDIGLSTSNCTALLVDAAQQVSYFLSFNTE